MVPPAHAVDVVLSAAAPPFSLAVPAAATVVTEPKTGRDLRSEGRRHVASGRRAADEGVTQIQGLRPRPVRCGLGMAPSIVARVPVWTRNSDPRRLSSDFSRNHCDRVPL